MAQVEVDINQLVGIRYPPLIGFRLFMEKTEIVNKFLQEGFLVSPKLLGELTHEKANNILPFLKGNTSIVLKTLDEPELIFSVNKSPPPPKTLLVKDFTGYYTQKYNSIKDILSTKLSPVSISKLSQGSRSVIIGLVLEKTPSGFVVEDPTGRIEARMAETENHSLQPPQPIQPNSVLGFTGEVKEKVFFVRSVSYPDIPIDKKIKDADLLLFFSFENSKPKIIVNREKEISIPTLPATISIKKGQAINILVCKPETAMTKTQAIDVLKLRCLPEQRFPNESCLISEEPDIFWLIQKESWTENYKGVRIISGENAELDLKKRLS